MSEIRLVVNLIPWTVGLGHLQIVFVDDLGNQTEIEVQGEAGEGYILAGEWVFGEPADHSLNTPNYQEQGEYYTTTLTLGNRTADAVWDQIIQINSQFLIANPQIDYDYYKNSNSYATTLLSTIGINAQDYTSQLIQGDIAWIPGIGVNVLKDADDAIPIKVVGSDGNDTFSDGALQDTFYGGKGDDTFFLMDDDGQLDLIVLGEGNDLVIGGGAEDRLAIAAHLINPDGSSGLSTANVSAIPLLGGFADPSGTPDTYRYVASAQRTIEGEVFVEIDSPETRPHTFVYDSGPSLWNEFSTFEQNSGYDAAENLIPSDQNSSAFEIVYTLIETDLLIDFSYLNVEDNYVTTSITVPDFEEGDFGIKFYNLASAGDGIHYVADTAGVSYIHNGGDYIVWDGLA